MVFNALVRKSGSSQPGTGVVIDPPTPVAGLFPNLDPAAVAVVKARPSVVAEMRKVIETEILPRQKIHDALMQERIGGGYFSVKRHWKKENVHAAMAGKVPALGASLDERLCQGQMRTKLARLRQCANSDEARPHAQKVNTLFAAAAAEVALERQEQERRDAAAFGAPFEPSPVLRALRQVAKGLDDAIGHQGTPTPPTKMISFDLRLLGIK